MILDHLNDELSQKMGQFVNLILNFIKEYDAINRSPGEFIDVVNYAFTSFDTLIVPNLNDNTREILNKEVDDNLILFTGHFAPTTVQLENNDRHISRGFISKKPYNLTENFIEENIFSIALVMDPQYGTVFIIDENGYFIIDNNYKESDEYYNQIMLFVGLGLIAAKKYVENAILTLIDADNFGMDDPYEKIFSDTNRSSILEYAINIKKDKTINNFLATSFEEKFKSNPLVLDVLNRFANDRYRLYSFIKNFKELNDIPNSDGFEEEDTFKMYSKHICNVFESFDIVIDGEEKDKIYIPDDISIEFENIAELIHNYKGDTEYKIMVLLNREIEDENNISDDDRDASKITDNIRNNFPLLALRQDDDIIITNFNNIKDIDIQSSFSYIQAFFKSQLQSRYGVILEDVAKRYETILEDLEEVLNDIKLPDDEDDNESISGKVVVKDKDKINKKSDNSSSGTINSRIDYDKHGDDFNLFEFRDLVIDNLKFYVDMFVNQMQLSAPLVKGIFNILKEYVGYDYHQYYSEDNVIDFSYVEEAIQSNSCIITITTGDNVIEAFIMFYDNDAKNYTILRLGDKYGKFSYLMHRKMYMRYNRVNESNKINLNLICGEGTYNLALDQLCEYLDCHTEYEILEKRFDITQWVLFVLEELFIIKYREIISGYNTYTSKDYHKYRDKFETYNMLKTLKCLETYLEEGIINENDIDNMIDGFEYNSLDISAANTHKVMNKDKIANKISMSLFNGNILYFIGDIRITEHDKEKHLINPQYYFDLSVEYDYRHDEPYTDLSGEESDYNLLIIDSLGDKSVSEFNKEMLSVLKYLKYCCDQGMQGVPDDTKTTKSNTAKRKNRGRQ